MRNAFIKTLFEEASKNKDIFLIVGDLGFGVIEEFQKRYPRQFLNAGVAEQNMTGMAAGLALSGKTVFTYSIANFTILRPLEQIRVDICYHRANVKIVSVGGGFHYYSLGSTHHATEDLSIMRTLPNMTVIAPCDPIEASLATKSVIAKKGPCYLRLANKVPIIHQTKPKFKIGKAIQLREGSDITLIATGGMLQDTLDAAQDLSEHGLQARVFSMHTIKPIDKGIVINAAQETKAIFTIEDHQVTGGLGSAVAEILSEMPKRAIIFKRFGIQDLFTKDIGSVEYIKKSLGLKGKQIANQIIKLLN